MPKKGAKATQRFARSGQLKKQIDSRKKQQKFKKQIQSRKALRGAPHQSEHKANDASDDDEGSKKPSRNQGPAKVSLTLDDVSENGDITSSAPNSKGHFSGMSVDDLLSGNFLDEQEQSSDDEDGRDSALDDLDEDTHQMELASLAKKDPEFFKYLQDNDKALLDFEASASNDLDVPETPESDEDDDMTDASGDEIPELTSEIIRDWQKALLETRSVKALKNLFTAYKVAARMNDDESRDETRDVWRIDDPTVFNKLIVTTLKYTPVVLEHHIPYKVMPNGKIKPPVQTSKFKALHKLIQSHFTSTVHFINTFPSFSEDSAELQALALKESARLVPYVASSRKAMRLWLKMCFDLWSTAHDEVRIAAILALRRLTAWQDESLLDLILRGTYTTFLRSCKTTSIHSLPNITLMKNSGADLYCTGIGEYHDHRQAYQHAFGFIRQLAVLLRNSMKVKSQDAYKQVYNWQYVHSVDFWASVLARACDHETKIRSRAESDLTPLIYPLIQTAIGAIGLIPNPRYFPLHLHLIRSLIHLTQRTRTYFNVSPFLIPIITSSLSTPATSSNSSKKKTLRPLDLQVHIRAPAEYLKTKTYAETILEEALYLFSMWSAQQVIQGSISFPEIIFPATVGLRKMIKKAKNPSDAGSSSKKAGPHHLLSQVKTFVERLEEGAQWVEKRREKVTFGPGNNAELQKWDREMDPTTLAEAPMGKWLKTQTKQREKKLALISRARGGEDEVIVEDD